MFHVETITSFDDPRLLPYRTMRRQFDHANQEIFVAEGEKVVRRLLESDLDVLSVLLPEKWLKEYEPLIKSRRPTIPVFTAAMSVLEQLTGFALYQGVLAVAKIPRLLSLTDGLNVSGRPHFFVAADGVSSAENMGALLRNCAAFGVHALIIDSTSCTPYLRRAVRNSMGTIFKLPVISSPGLATSLRELQARGVKCVAAHAHTQEKVIYDTNLATDCCIVLGSEGTGISPSVVAACNELVRIPMANDVDSLNVGAAAAVFLYEAARQRAALAHPQGFNH